MTIAKYIRLSMEDAKTDSLSIENQRTLLDRAISDTFEDDVEILEFVDNGYSGTNFERPQIQELLELVRAGRIDCILVKDFSRFGRDIVETGYFIEQVFPLFRVRFIAVSDGYDSNDFKQGAGDLEVVFKFLCNELYSRDLSRKIKSARAIKMRRGELQTKNCLYGYVLDENRKLTIDEKAAPAVRMIFLLCSEGKKLEHIRKALYTAKVPTPGEHKDMRNGKLDGDPKCIWEASVIKNILTDERYIGTYVAGKTEMLEVGSNKQVKKDESEWVKIPGHHPAIIEQSLFDAVQAISNAKKLPPKRKLDTSKRYAASQRSPLKSKVICGCCGHVMVLNCTKNASFRCNFSRAAADAVCHKLSVKERELAGGIYTMIRNRAREILKSDAAETLNTRTVCTGKPDGHERYIEALRNLYERFSAGEMTAEAYREQKDRLDAEISRIKQVHALQAARIEHEKSAKEKSAEARRIAALVAQSNKLTQEIVDALIEKILVYPGNRIEILWKIETFSGVARVETEVMEYAG